MVQKQINASRNRCRRLWTVVLAAALLVVLVMATGPRCVRTYRYRQLLAEHGAALWEMPFYEDWTATPAPTGDTVSLGYARTGLEIAQCESITLHLGRILIIGSDFEAMLGGPSPWPFPDHAGKTRRVPWRKYFDKPFAWWREALSVRPVPWWRAWLMGSDELADHCALLNAKMHLVDDHSETGLFQTAAINGSFKIQARPASRARVSSNSRRGQIAAADHFRLEIFLRDERRGVQQFGVIQAAERSRALAFWRDTLSAWQYREPIPTELMAIIEAFTTALAPTGRLVVTVVTGSVAIENHRSDLLARLLPLIPALDERHMVFDGETLVYHGGSLLHTAAMVGSLAAAEQLLAAGMPIDPCSMRGQTPLHTAYRFGHNAIAQYLLARGANPDVRDVLGFAPADLIDYRLTILDCEPIRPPTEAGKHIPEHWQYDVFSAVARAQHELDCKPPGGHRSFPVYAFTNVRGNYFALVVNEHPSSLGILMNRWVKVDAVTGDVEIHELAEAVYYTTQFAPAGDLLHTE